MPEGFDPSNMPDDFDPDNMPEGVSPFGDNEKATDEVSDDIEIAEPNNESEDVPSDKRIFGYPAIEMRVK